MSEKWWPVYLGLDVLVEDEEAFANNPLRHNNLVSLKSERVYDAFKEDEEGFADTEGFFEYQSVSFGPIQARIYTTCWYCSEKTNETRDLGLCLPCRDELRKPL